MSLQSRFARVGTLTVSIAFTRSIYGNCTGFFVAITEFSQKFLFCRFFNFYLSSYFSNYAYYRDLLEGYFRNFALLLRKLASRLISYGLNI